MAHGVFVKMYTLQAVMNTNSQHFTCTSATKYINIPYKYTASDISIVTG